MPIESCERMIGIGGGIGLPRAAKNRRIDAEMFERGEVVKSCQKMLEMRGRDEAVVGCRVRFEAGSDEGRGRVVKSCRELLESGREGGQGRCRRKWS